MEPFRKSRSSDVKDESVDSFLRRRFGAGVASIATAGLHGIYAASTEDLSAKAVLGKLCEYEADYGSIMMGLWKGRNSATAKREKEEERARWAPLGAMAKEREGWAMYGLKGGLETLIKGLQEGCEKNGVEIRLNERVTSLQPVEKGVEVGRAPFTTTKTYS